MKTASLVLLLLSMVAAPFAQAAFYQWTDADGVMHFTDDRKNVPMEYRKKARKLDLADEPSPAGSGVPQPLASPKPQPSQQPPPSPLQQPSPQSRQPSPQSNASAPGGRSEQWWRQSFSALRSQVKALQDGLPAKQEKLTELRRERAIHQRARDREAVNAMTARIAADETRIAELLSRLDALEQEAARAAVPAEWRR